MLQYMDVKWQKSDYETHASPKVYAVCNKNLTVWVEFALVG